jgi:hypothetical protein
MQKPPNGSVIFWRLRETGDEWVIGHVHWCGDETWLVEIRKFKDTDVGSQTFAFDEIEWELYT